MAVHFNALKVKAINKETKDCVSVVFEVPQNLQQQYNFLQGQNITLKKIIDGQDLRRSYSICNAPYENELKVAIKKVDGGKFSTYANQILKVGDILDVMAPTGKFNTELNVVHKKKYVAFAAGSGITPIISLIKATLHTEPYSHFTLVFGNRSKASIIFFEEIEALKNKYLNRFSVIHILSREQADADINFGKIDEAKLATLKKLIDFKAQNEFFICGPEAMIFCVKDFLTSLGIEKNNIHFELFGTAAGKSKKLDDVRTFDSNTTVKQSTVTIKADGRSFNFTMQDDGTSILDAALQQGADLPFACKGGMCCTCKAKLIEGKVQMDVTWGLEQTEIEQGYILTCQSHAITQNVVVDFDEK
jgi:ring-1,2-phenylacetyl-CoA epoxidase subunit PaaE